MLQTKGVFTRCFGTNISLSEYTQGIQDLNPLEGNEVSVALSEVVVIMKDTKIPILEIEGASEFFFERC